MHAILLDSLTPAQREWLLANAAFLPGYLTSTDGRALIGLLVANFAHYVGENCGSDDCAD